MASKRAQGLRELTRREHQVLELMAQKCTNKELASELTISFRWAWRLLCDTQARVLQRRPARGHISARRNAALFALVGLAVLAGACGGRNASPAGTPSSSLSSNASPTASPDGSVTSDPTVDLTGPFELYEDGIPTGIAAVDEVVSAVGAGAAGDVLEVLHFTKLPCSAAPTGIGGPPVCRTKEGESGGTPVEVFEVNICEAEWRRADEVADIAERLASPELGVLAVGTVSQGEWALFVASPRGYPWAALTIGLQGVVAVKIPCGPTPLGPFLDRAKPFILPPRASQD